MLKELFSCDEKLAILAGAGISLDSPSNLLDGRTFMREALRRVSSVKAADPTPKTGWLRKLQRKETSAMPDENWVLSILDQPDREFRRPGEFLRFEVLMAELVYSGLDHQLRVLDCLDQCEYPNYNHYVLADLLRTGHVVLTTNFDRLIEMAYERIRKPSDPRLHVVYEDQDFPITGPGANGAPTLWKLHGSCSVFGQNTRHSIQATLESVLATDLSKHKRKFLEHVLREYDLLLVGYSGGDDLDIVPIIADTASSKRLIWVDHQEGEGTLLKCGCALTIASKSGWEQDVVGRDRVRFNIDHQRITIRRMKDILLLTSRTKSVMDALKDIYCPSESYLEESDEFQFGRKYPEKVAQYFEDWAAGFPEEKTAPYQFIADVFAGRRECPNIKERLAIIDKEIKRLRVSSTATPHERLLEKIDRFNERGKARNDEFNLGLRAELMQLIPELSPDLEGAGQRLLACIAWEVDGPDTSEELFRQAVEIDRHADRPQQEFSTLTSWRGFCGYSQWSDLFAENEIEPFFSSVNVSRLEEVRHEEMRIRALIGARIFPEEETRRIHELANKLGYFPQLWLQALYANIDVIDDDHDVLIVLHHRLRKMKRFYLDVGDVASEMLATYIEARMYLIAKQHSEAAENFLRAAELGRIANNTRIRGDIALFLGYCEPFVPSDYFVRIRSLLQTSMWGAQLSTDDHLKPIHF